MRAIPDHVLAMLDDLTVVGNVVQRYPYPLERDAYVALDKVLSALGGKWTGRKVQAHVFHAAVDPRELIDACLASGQYVDPKRDNDFFETPAALAAELVRRAGVQRGDRALEPSAGHGRIARALRDAGAIVFCVERDEQCAEQVRCSFERIRNCDLLKMHEQPWSTEWPFFDRIVMNPPFSGQADIDHVHYAFRLLAPGGTLVSVMSAGVAFRQNRKAVDFRTFVESHGGSIEDLPEGSFKESDTNVRTVVVTLRRPS